MSAAIDLSDEERAWFQSSRSYRLGRLGCRIDGADAVDFAKYAYTTEIIDEDAPKVTILKGAQMGLTIACVLKALEKARAGGLRGIGYFFPGHGEVTDFSKARFAPLMEQNGHIWPASGDVDAANLRKIRDCYLYFRAVGQIGNSASRSTSNIKSIPLDCIILDEVDEMDVSRVDTVYHRLDASPNPQIIQLSTPTLPGSIIDLAYQASDQRMWFWECERCNAETCLEEKYPDCIAEPQGADPFYLCSGCREPLARLSGRWHAQSPDVSDHRGYRISQLSSPTKTALDIVLAAEEAEATGRRREFYNQTLGMPFAEIDDEISEQQMNDCLTDNIRPLRHAGPAAMGVDPGKVHHYNVVVRVSDRDVLQIARGEASSYEELGAIAKRYNVESGVIDAGFDPTAVMSFVKEHPGWYGCLYVSGREAGPDHNHKDRMVKAGRDWCLDRVHRAVLNKSIKFYAKDEGWPEYVAQLNNLKRTVMHNQLTGQKKPKWIVLGSNKNDHLFHATGYSLLAADRVGLEKATTDAHYTYRPKKTKGRRTAMSM